jgi:sugar lactone lactonase YvrE
MSKLIYASAPYLHAIVRSDMDGDLDIVTTELPRPRGISVAADGTLFVTDIQTGWLHAVDPKGKVRKHAGPFSWPSGLAVGKDGNYYVADSRGIVMVEPEGTTRVFAEIGGQEFIAWDGKNQYFYCAKGRTVTRVDLDGKSSKFHELTDYATGLACDLEGNVYTSGEHRTDPGVRGALWYIARFEPSGAGRVYIDGGPLEIRVLGYSSAGYLLFSTHPRTIGVARTENDQYIRNSAFAEYAATPADFQYP